MVVIERKADPDPSISHIDLCDHWHMVSDKRCRNYWREEVVLTEPAIVEGQSMFGRYHAGTWRFCRTHARIFKRDRVS